MRILRAMIGNMVYLGDNPRTDALAQDYLRKYGDGRSEAYDELRKLLLSERERGLRNLVADVCALLRMPEETFDKTHPEETRIAHLTARTIEEFYRSGVRIARLLRWDSTSHPACPGCAKVLRHPGKGYSCAVHPSMAET